MKEKIEIWSRTLSERQRIFVPPELRRAIQFLHDSRSHRQGWGPFPGMPSDLHHTSCAVQALGHCKDDSSIGLAADGAIYLRETVNGHLSSLSIGQLADLASALGSEANPDRDYIGKLIEISKARLAEAASSDEFSIVTVSKLLKEMLLLHPNTTDIENWIEHIIELQRPDDGGWPVIAGESSSPIATAAALQLLSLIQNEESRSARAKGLRYLEAYVGQEGGWQKIGQEMGTFNHTFILQALAETPGSDFGFIVTGVDELVTRVNPDGGWGGGNGEASNIECTSRAIVALVASGYNSFVPSRLTHAALHDARLFLDNAEKERNRLEHDFEHKVQVQCGNVVKERDQLRHKLSGLNEKLQAAERMASEERARWAERTSQARYEIEASIRKIDVETTSLKLEKILLIVLTISAITGLTFITRTIDERNYSIAFNSILAVCVVASVILILMLYRRRKNAIKKIDEEAEEVFDDFDVTRYALPDENNSLAALRTLFWRLTYRLESTIREEIIYRMFRDAVDLPPDVGKRYMEELGFRLDLPAEVILSLSHWFERALELKPRERKLLFEQIRRALLP